jgi:hypothetical protein
VDHIDWSKLKGIPSWTPSDAVPYILRRLADRLVQLDENIYLITVGANHLSETNRAPYVTAAMWADSVGAARRSRLHDLEADVDDCAKTPPVEMLLLGGAQTYGEIISELRKNGVYRTSMEHATYRMTDGKFIEATIDTRMGHGPQGYKFCFRSQTCEDLEVPYAIYYFLRR